MRSILIGIARVLLLAPGLLVLACSGVTPVIPLVPSASPRQLNSFMGVHFGDTFEEVERRFPAGTPQTSPYGAPAYMLENVSSSSIDYQDVVYEFAEGAGMQMVVAHFVPSQSAAVYQQLQTTLGPPAGADKSGADAASAEASWQLPDGGSVMFSGPLHRLALIGKTGGPLKEDIRLRDTEVPSVS